MYIYDSSHKVLSWAQKKFYAYGQVQGMAGASQQALSTHYTIYI